MGHFAVDPPRRTQTQNKIALQFCVPFVAVVTRRITNEAHLERLSQAQTVRPVAGGRQPALDGVRRTTAGELTQWR